ncbi:hypothetical protein BDCR2A_01826 [Borrelia duttonii CR2A]|uniref:Uncharacterized protein n=1 Tax=Borrelia duttonii CR2A TaxID=1432657 RepID=W6TG19_9SPIR|nr:hypothetical protein [Borrelia duttonii]ETZ17253.1 hypothetical protein BDCR2A_01826 [Borrelia duttonii CR2A]
MKKINEITLYKVGEVVEILKEKFDYTISTQVLCRKASALNAYVKYNDINYLPEDIICDLVANIKKRQIKLNTQIIVEEKIEKIKKFLEEYNKKYTLPPIKAINTLKSRNPNTNTIIKAVIQLKQEIKKTQEDLQEKDDKIDKLQKTIQKTQEDLQEKDGEITRLKIAINKTKEDLQEKDEEITRLKIAIKKTKEEMREEIQDKNQEITRIKIAINKTRENMQKDMLTTLLEPRGAAYKKNT